MRKSTIAIGIAAALSAQAFATHDAAAATGKNTKTSKATGPIQSANRFAFPRHVQPNGSTVLYSQTTGTYDGSAVTSNSISTDDFDSFAADDFTVTDAAGWNVSAFNFNVSFRQFSADPGTTYNVHVYSDASGAPNDTAAALCGGDELAGTLSSGDTALSVALPAACSLPAGHYWVVLQANINFATAGNQMYWSAFSPATVPGTVAQWKNPGDGFGSGCTSWSASTSCDLTGNTFGFEVVGAVGGGGTCPAGGICLTVTLGTDTTAGACGTADSLDVTVGDQVNFCYTVENNTSGALDYHTLSDNINGEIFRLMNQPLAAGATYQYNRIVTAGATETNTATWTAQDELPGYSSTVTTGGGPITDRIFCDGFDGAACGGGGGGFIDISSTGTALGLDDDASAAVTMPFSFNFYGNTSNQLCVDNNGFILFGTTTCPTSGLFSNKELPSSDLPAAAIMPLWDDFDSESGEVYYATQGTAPNRKFIVEWYQRAHYNGANNTDTATFEAIFDEATGKVSFQYLDVAYTANGGSEASTNCDNGVCATIGLQNDPTLANQFSFNQASIADNTGIDWEATDPQIFTASDTVTLNVGAPDIQVAPTSISGTAPVGGTSAATLDISNVGNRDLIWSIGEAGPASHFPIGPRYVPTTRKAGERITAANRPSSLQGGPTKPATQQRLQPQPQGGGVPAYAFSIQSSTSGKWVSFDATSPGTLNQIATSSEITFSGDFVADDFSKEYFIAYPSGDLKTVDTTTGATATVGSTGLGDRPRDLAWDATTNTLFGAVVDGDVGTDLYKYDASTGAATRIGAISGVGASGYSFVMGLAVDNNGLMYGVEIVSASLIAVDKTTGAATTIGSLGIDTRFSQALSFDPNTNTLYLIEGQTNNMYTVDLTTGAATLVGATGTSSDLQVAAFAIALGHGPCSQPQDQPWLSVAPTSGTTAASGTDPVTVTLSGAGLSDGDVRNGTLCVRSNDPDSPLVQVPVQMTVGAAPPAAPSAAKAFAPTSVATGTASTLTITLSNTQAGVATLNANLVDTFPSGLVVAATPNASTTCAGGAGVTATAGAGSVTLGTGAAIPASGSCTVKVDVQSATAGSYNNTIPAGGLQTDLGNSAAAASASLTVTGGGNPNLVDSGPVSISIPATGDGLYINWVTGATATAGSGAPGWDFNPYLGSGNLVAFFWGSTSSPNNGGVVTATTGGNYPVLASGATIGSTSTFSQTTSTAYTAPWQAGVTGGYLGVRFQNESTGQVNYGYVQITSSSPNGFPMTITRYVYDNSGAAITIP